jgi:hypothetical protein
MYSEDSILDILSGIREKYCIRERFSYKDVRCSIAYNKDENLKMTYMTNNRTLVKLIIIFPYCGILSRQ